MDLEKKQEPRLNCEDVDAEMDLEAGMWRTRKRSRRDVTSLVCAMAEAFLMGSVRLKLSRMR